jgi:hypothetical protein
VTYADVEAAAGRIEGVAHRTPVATSRTLDERLGASVFFKCENLQRMGAFKMRGAYNAIAQLTPEQRKRGVVAYSSGNHAQAIALASRLLETNATIVMPRDAPSAKRQATEGYGARVVTYDPATETREAIAAALHRESNGTLIPPFDHPHVIAGQGTAAKELFAEVGKLDVLITPCGGGGLLSGSAIAAHALSRPHRHHPERRQRGSRGRRRSVRDVAVFFYSRAAAARVARACRGDCGAGNEPGSSSPRTPNAGTPRCAWGRGAAAALPPGPRARRRVRLRALPGC